MNGGTFHLLYSERCWIPIVKDESTGFEELKT